MELTSKKIIKTLLKRYNLLPQKKLGQNFLVAKNVFKLIIKSANLRPKDIVLEIGPGIGNLTLELVKKVKKIIAIEKDKKLIKILKEVLKNFTNVKIIQGDILKTNINSKLLTKNYKIVANLPYYIVSPIIRKFLESQNPPRQMILMVQKEVAQRICSKARNMNLLAVSVQFYAKTEIVDFISKKSFWPQPKVDSAIIKLKVKKQKPKVDKNLFFKIVKAGFSHPRKQLINNLSKELKLDKEKVISWLSKNKIKPTQRAETLSIKDWIKLTKTFGK